MHGSSKAVTDYFQQLNKYGLKAHDNECANESRSVRRNFLFEKSGFQNYLKEFFFFFKLLLTNQ